MFTTIFHLNQHMLSSVWVIGVNWTLVKSDDLKAAASLPDAAENDEAWFDNDWSIIA